MPVPAPIAAAAGQFATNTGFLEKVTAGIAPEQWLTRPNDHSNHIAWIMGHVIWARQILITRVGGSWPKEGLEPYARSARLDEGLSYPSPEESLALLRESDAALAATLEALTPEMLDAPAPPGPPTRDGKVTGFIAVLAWHETYHLGQLAYLRSWLGYPGVFG
ncbi:MAG: DinB family protein [Terracidiphilus sp.]